MKLAIFNKTLAFDVVVHRTKRHNTHAKWQHHSAYMPPGNQEHIIWFLLILATNAVGNYVRYEFECAVHAVNKDIQCLKSDYVASV